MPDICVFGILFIVWEKGSSDLNGVSSTILVFLLCVSAAFADVQTNAVAVSGKANTEVDVVDFARNWASSDMNTGEGVPMDDISFPVDHFPNGTVRAQFKAKKAFIPDDENDFVKAEGLVLELYDEHGGIQGYYIAEKCIFDRTTRTAYCEGRIRIEYRAPERTIRVDGDGMQFDLVSRNAKILANPKVTMQEIMGELKGAFK